MSENKKSCFGLYLGPEILGGKNGAKIFLLGLLAISPLLWGVIDTTRELRSFLREEIPPFEQLRITEGEIKTEKRTRSSLRNVFVVTSDGLVGTSSWWPCSGRDRAWADQFEGKRAKVWYFNKRIVQMQVGNAFDGQCKYNESLRADENAREEAIRSFFLNTVWVLIGLFLARKLCRHVSSVKVGQ